MERRDIEALDNSDFFTALHAIVVAVFLMIFSTVSKKFYLRETSRRNSKRYFRIRMIALEDNIFIWFFFISKTT
ncbi:hypothetical protein BELL_0144g00020 [Botrytis elliptica]|uniref:Uncharacterized protein n=1 Tax=Botrytis elliptica TaxID=278938 RepID=A0A4Z1JSB0_9HELO|nr:hypothetical protein BELL_0144g00020 [Botrytis elliptica]